MGSYSDLLNKKTSKTKRKIENLIYLLREEEEKLMKEYFKIGSKVIYRDYDGYMEGEVKGIEYPYINVYINNVNGDRRKYLQGFKTIKAEYLELK